MNARLAGDPEAPRQRNPELSTQVEEVILHALERNPLKRFPSEVRPFSSEAAEWGATSGVNHFGERSAF